MGQRRRRACTNGRPKCRATGKTIFDTQDEADNALRAILAKPESQDNPYKPARSIDCGACGGYHLTSKENRPGVTARRRQHRRKSRRNDAPDWHTSDPTTNAFAPARQAGASWTTGFLDTPEESHLTYRITVGPSDSGDSISTS